MFLNLLSLKPTVKQMPNNGGFGGDASSWHVPNSGASREAGNGSSHTTASQTLNSLGDLRTGYWNRFASLAPILKIPAIGKSGALERFHGLQSTISAIKHDAFGCSLFINQGQTLAIVTQTGKFLHKLIEGNFKKPGNSFDLTITKDNITFPLATVRTALALIPNIFLSIRHFKSNYRPSMLRRYTSTAFRKPCHFEPGRPLERRKWGQFLLGGLLPRRGHL